MPAREARAFLRPVESRFETRAPSVEKVVEQTKARRGETIGCGGAAAANQLGLTRQLNCSAGLFDFGSFPRAASWQASCGVQACTALAAYDGRTVVQVRSCALDRVGPETARQALRSLSQRLSPIEASELKSAGSSLPAWLLSGP